VPRRASQPPERKRRADLLKAISGSIQWKAALEMIRSKEPSGAARSSNEVTWNSTPTPVRRRRAAAIMAGPMSMAVRW